MPSIHYHLELLRKGTGSKRQSLLLRALRTCSEGKVPLPPSLTSPSSPLTLAPFTNPLAFLLHDLCFFLHCGHQVVFPSPAHSPLPVILPPPTPSITGGSVCFCSSGQPPFRQPVTFFKCDTCVHVNIIVMGCMWRGVFVLASNLFSPQIFLQTSTGPLNVLHKLSRPPLTPLTLRTLNQVHHVNCHFLMCLLSYPPSDLRILFLTGAGGGEITAQALDTNFSAVVWVP